MYQSAVTPISQGLLTHNIGISPRFLAGSDLSPISGWQGVVKRALDVTVALLLLAALTVPLLMLALLIWWETPGWPLFHQLRIGQANVGFEIWKLRTMRAHVAEPGRLVQATPHDKRVTRFGNFLRRRSLDELPQLINVLRGEMSLVGPRPHAPGTRAGGKPFEMVTPHYAARHRVRPGITGLAQIRGWRGETETEAKLLRRVESDLEYIDNWSLWLDVVILMRTMTTAFVGRNAY